MKIYFFCSLILFFQILGCRRCPSMEKVLMEDSVRKIFLPSATVLCTFEQYAPFQIGRNQVRYCLKDLVLILKDGVEYSFEEDYVTNYVLIQMIDSKASNDLLKNHLLPEAEYSPPFFLNSPARLKSLTPERRLSDSDYFFQWGNIQGNKVITSKSIYKSLAPLDSLKVFISFNIKGDFLMYSNIDEYVFNNVNAYQSDQLCPVPKQKLRDDILVVDKVDKYWPLSDEQASKLGLMMIALDTIRVPIAE